MDEQTNNQLLAVIVKIRDLARTGLKPDIYEDEETWLRHKLDFIAGQANYAVEILSSSAAEGKPQ